MAIEDSKKKKKKKKKKEEMGGIEQNIYFYFAG